MKKEQLFNVAPAYESPRIKVARTKTRRVLCGSPLGTNSADPGWSLDPDSDNKDVNIYGDL